MAGSLCPNGITRGLLSHVSPVQMVSVWRILCSRPTALIRIALSSLVLQGALTLKHGLTRTGNIGLSAGFHRTYSRPCPTHELESDSNWKIGTLMAAAQTPFCTSDARVPHHHIVRWCSMFSLDEAVFHSVSIYGHGHAQELVIVETHTGSPSEFFAQWLGWRMCRCAIHWMCWYVL